MRIQATGYPPHASYIHLLGDHVAILADDHGGTWWIDLYVGGWVVPEWHERAGSVSVN